MIYFKEKIEELRFNKISKMSKINVESFSNKLHLEQSTLFGLVTVTHLRLFEKH